MAKSLEKFWILLCLKSAEEHYRLGLLTSGIHEEVLLNAFPRLSEGEVGS